jgi:hypothetical protein
MEDIFFSAFLFLFLLKSSQLRMLTSILPVIDAFITSYYDMSLIHAYEFRFNCNIFVINRTSYSITENDNPLIVHIFHFGNQDTVFSTSNYFLKSSHVFDVLFIDSCIPENYTHVITFWFSERKN